MTGVRAGANGGLHQRVLDVQRSAWAHRIMRQAFGDRNRSGQAGIALGPGTVARISHRTTENRHKALEWWTDVAYALDLFGQDGPIQRLFP
jgi:hypothetical protein